MSTSNKKRGLKALWNDRKFLKDSEKDTDRASFYFCGIISILGISYGFFSVYKSFLPKLYVGALEAFFILSISTFTSLLASSFFSTFQALFRISQDEEINRRKRFQKFFGCEKNNEGNSSKDNDKEKDKVAIVLPSYRYSDYTENDKTLNKTYDEKENLIKENIPKKTDGTYRNYLNSIKIFFDSAAISFSQADAIAAANIIALFSKMSMRLPTIRTDLQSLSKIFQYDENENFLTETETFNRIQKYISKKNLNYVVSDDDLMDIINNRADDTQKRKYNTYILIGMYSNILLMELLNCGLPENVTKHFTCITSVDGSGKVIRFIKIKNHGGKDYETPKLLLKESEIKNDYALIARCKFLGKTFFVCAGITVVATKAAARFLDSHWEDLYNSGNDTFAVVFPVPNTEHKFTFSPKGSVNWWTYPEDLKKKIFPGI